MPKAFLWPAILIAFAAFNGFAQSKAHLDVNSFLSSKANNVPAEELDIAYQQIFPRFEENQDPQKQVALEIFFAEYDGSEKAKRKLEWIKELLADEKAASKNFSFESMFTGPSLVMLEQSPELAALSLQLELKEPRLWPMHEGTSFKSPLYSAPETKSKRGPSAVSMKPRVFWSLIRTVTTAGGVYASLVVAQGVHPGTAAIVGLVPGLASAGLTYFSGHYGGWLTSGAWSSWLLDSPSFLARNLRKGLGLTPESFQKSLVKKKKLFQNKYPDLYKSMPEAFEAAKPKARLKTIMARMRTAEEYVKWWVAEVAFTAVALKMPQAMAGISEVTSLTSATGEVLMGSTMGMAAQGPGDIAIQLRKYQMVEELKEAVKKGKTSNTLANILVDGKRAETSLLDEIDMVLAKTGPHKNYAINDLSHPALQKIENWARSRATMLSFFSVVGVGMEIAHIPLARPWLMAVGAGGGLYYAKVRGWTRFSASDKWKRALSRVETDRASGAFKNVFSRMCLNKFAARN